MITTVILITALVILYLFVSKRNSYHLILSMYMASICAILFSCFMYISRSTVFQFIFPFDYYIYSQLYKIKLPIPLLSRLYSASVALLLLTSFITIKKLKQPKSISSFFMLMSIVIFVMANDISISKHIHVMINNAPTQISKTFWREISFVINLYTEILFLIFMVYPIIILLVKTVRSKIYINRRYSLLLFGLVTVAHGFIFLLLRKTYAGIWFSNTDVSKIPITSSGTSGFFFTPIVMLFGFAIITAITLKIKPSGPFKLMTSSQWIEQNLSLSDGIGMAFHTHKNSLIALRQHLELIQIYMEKDDEEKVCEHFDISYNVINAQLDSIKKTLKHLRSSRAPARQVDLSECIRTSVKKLSFDGYLELNLLDGCIVMGDHDDLCETFLNVLFNAEYALNGKEDQQIKVKMIKEDEFIEVDVWDNGCGISKENLKHVFTPFFSTKPALQYGGLGLSSVRSTINAHRGDVKIKSQENQYTVIKMVFPAYTKNL